MQLAIGGHTDHESHDAQRLSKQSIHAMVRYPTQQGIAANRLRSNDYGKTHTPKTALKTAVQRFRGCLNLI